LGHGSDGKTSLSESMLYLTKASDRLGKVADGNTVADFDAEEIKRQISISMTVLPINVGDCKLNVIDTPGFPDFEGEVAQALRVSDAAIILCGAKNGIGVGTEKAWKKVVRRNKLPRMIYVGKLDEENADFAKTLEDLRAKFGASISPVVVPVMDGDKTIGIYDIASGKAFDADGKEVAAPDAAQFSTYYEYLAENVAETDEALMDKFFSGETLTPEDLKQGIAAGVKAGSLTPVFCGSAFTDLGTMALLQGIVDYCPSPAEGTGEKALDGSEVLCDASGKTVAFVFKTQSDQYGKFSFFKVLRGKVTNDMSLVNARTGESEKLGHIFVVRGKKNEEVKEISCGDIGAVAKLADVKTGDTLCAAGAVVELAAIDFLPTCYSLAITPKVRGQEDKISTGLNRLKDEDLTFTLVNNPETRQLVISGMGDIHIDVLCSKLKSKFGVEVQTEAPRVPYREKIRKKVKVEGKHKKQSGGSGQFGHVWVEFEPCENEELVFEEKIFGGSVPKNFHPAVEKGLRESMQKGVLAGYPMVFLKATLVDGSYHDVDSNEMSFKLAAQLAYRNGLPTANPVLLEPIGALRVAVPGSYAGDIMGDVSKRRGRVMGMDSIDDVQIIEAEVPMAEMHSYAIDLRSMAQGRGSFTFAFVRYEDAPANVQQKVIEDAKTEE